MTKNSGFTLWMAAILMVLAGVGPIINPTVWVLSWQQLFTLISFLFVITWIIVRTIEEK